MRSRTKRRARRLALVTVAVPVAAWALEQVARRAEARDRTSPASRRLRQGADVCDASAVGHWPTGWTAGRSPGALRGIADLGQASGARSAAR